MIHGLLQFLKDFYERNLFERIIIYAFVAAFITKFVFEFLLGQWSFSQSQNIQWIFYGLLGLDYVVSYKKILNITVNVNLMSILALVFLIMTAHGLFVGFLSHNQVFVIFNDAVPLFMIALNILRMQSLAEARPVDFSFLLGASTLLAFGACFFGLLADLLGQPSGASLGNATIFLPLFFAGLFVHRPFPKWVLLLGGIMLVLTSPEMNRTSMAFIAAVTGVYLLIKLIKNPVYGVGLSALAVIVIALGIILVPKDSGTFQRINALGSVDLNQRTGSIGERQAEWDAIQTKLKSRGETIQWLGLGFGGLYNVQFTHQYNQDYGHAHYSWAWFNLRFGKVGFIYLAILVSALLWNGFSGLYQRNETGVFVALLCFMGLVYCATYVNAVFLLSGIHFLLCAHPKDSVRRVEQGAQSSAAAVLRA
jgi:hypothetical protein